MQLFDFNNKTEKSSKTRLRNYNYRISANSFRGNFFVFESKKCGNFLLHKLIVAAETCEGGKLFKGGNYSRAETICGNTVIVQRIHKS